MTTTLVTLTGDVTDAIGTDFDTRRTKAYVRHNTDKIVTDSGPFHLGSGTVNVNADGTFELPNVVASTSLVTNLQATVYVDYADPATRQRATAMFGPYDLSAATGTVDIRTLEAVQALDPSFASTFMTNAQALLDAQTTISGIDSTDSAVAGLISDPLVGPLTNDALAASFVRTISPLDPAYGAVGDDTADDTAALAAAIAAAPAIFTTVDLRGRTYRVTDQIAVPAGVKVHNGTIHQTGIAKKTLVPTGDNVTIRDVEGEGRHATATASADEFFIYAEGTSAAAPLRNLHIEGVNAHHFGMYGAYLKWVDRFTITDNDFTDLGYAGVMGLSVLNGWITNNRVKNVLAGFSSNGYGIAVTRARVTSLITDPRSKNVVIQGNIVDDCPWEGIDTHGGDHITIADNTVNGCGVGIAVVPANDGAGVSTYAPLDCTVTNNTIDSGVTDGSGGNGIYFCGAAGVLGTSIQHATGLIAGNTVRGHGDEAVATSGGIYLNNTAGVAVTGNTVIEPSPHGILVLNDNYGVAVTGNTVIDQWSNTVTDPTAFRVPSGYVNGAVTGNTHRAEGGKAAATYKNVQGLSVNSVTSVSLELAANYLDECTTPLSGGAAVTRTTSRGEHVFKRVAKFSAGNVTDPGISFEAETTMGFYRIAAGDMGLTIGGVQQIDYGNGYAIHRNGFNLVFGTTIGTMLASGATQKMGFWGKAPVVQPTAVADATDAATVITQLNSLLAKLRTIGIIAT